MHMPVWIKRLLRQNRLQRDRERIRHELDVPLFITRLEERRVLSVDVVADVSAGIVAFSGDSDSETLDISVHQSGLLQHNLPHSPTSNLVSRFDMDSFTAGEQSIVASTITSLSADLDSGDDLLTFGDGTSMNLTSANIDLKASNISVNGPVLTFRMFQIDAEALTVNTENPALFPFGGVAFDQDSSPDQATMLPMGLLADGQGVEIDSGNDGAAGPFDFPSDSSGFDSSLTTGRLLGLGGSGSLAAELPTGNDGSTVRAGVEFSWSGPDGLTNTGGDDLVVYTSSSSTLGPDGFMIQVRDTNSGGWSDWIYKPAGSRESYASGSDDGAFVTTYDLSDFGITDGDQIDRIRMVNLNLSDRIDGLGSETSPGSGVFVGAGVVIPDDNGSTSGVLPDPGPLAAFDVFNGSFLDPDPLYIGAVVPLNMPLPVALADAVTIDSNAIGIVSDGVVWQTIQYSSVNNLTLNTYRGQDDVTVNLGSLPTNISLNGGDATDDSVTIKGTSGADAITLRDKNVTHAGTTIELAEFEQLTVDSANGDDQITLETVDSTFPSTVDLIGGGAADAILISSDGSATSGSVDFVTSAVTVDAGGQAGDSLTIVDTEDTTDDTVTITEAQVGAAAGNNYFGAGGSVTYSGVANLTVLTGSGDDWVFLTEDPSINSDPLRNPAELLEIRTSDGNDQVLVQSVDAGFQAALMIDTEGGILDGGLDYVAVDANLKLGSVRSEGSVAISSDTIDINQSIDTTAGFPRLATVALAVNGQLNIASGVDVQAAGAVSQTGVGPVSISGDISTTGHEISFASAVSLADDVALSTGAGGGNITFSDTIDGTVDCQENLTLDAGVGDVELMEAVGATVGLGNVTITAAGDVTVNSTITAASLAQVSGSGSSRFDEMVTLKGTGGLSVQTANAVFNGDLDTIAAGVGQPILVNVSGDVEVNGAVQSGVGFVAMIAGGSIRMSNGSVIESSETVQLAAGGDIEVARVLSAKSILMLSATGAILDARDINGSDASAPLVSLGAAMGIGAGNALELETDELVVANTVAGDVNVDNISGNALTLSGLENAGGGNVSVTNNAAIIAADQVINRGGGDLLLETSAGDLVIDAYVAALDGEGSIRLVAAENLIVNDASTGPDLEISGSVGTIVGRAGGEVVLAPTALVKTGTGQISNVPVAVELIPVDNGGSNVTSGGEASIRVTPGEIGETNFLLFVDWSDGTVDKHPPQPSRGVTRFDGGVTNVFDHRYFGNPHPTNPAADIPVVVEVFLDARFDMATGTISSGIDFFRNGGERIFTVEADALTVPGEGLFASIKVVKEEIRPVELLKTTTPFFATVQSVNAVEETESFAREQVTIEDGVRRETKFFFRKVDAAGKESVDRGLPNDLFDRDIEAIFKKFPNGRYRIYRQDPGQDRPLMIRELRIDAGTVVPEDFKKGIEGSSAASGSKDAIPADSPDETSVDDNSPEKDSAGKASKRGAGNDSSDDDSRASDDNAAATVSGALLASVVIADWYPRASQSTGPSNDSMSKAARLARRLLKRP